MNKTKIIKSNSKQNISRRTFCLATLGAALFLEELVIGIGQNHLFPNETKPTNSNNHLSTENILSYLFEIQGQYLNLDSNKITAAKEKIDQLYTQVHNQFQGNDLPQFFRTTHQVLQNNGITYQNNAPFIDGLLQKKLDCDGLSYLYIGIGQELGLPVTGIQLPNHLAVHASGINFEPTSLRAEEGFMTTIDYIKLFNSVHNNADITIDHYDRPIGRIHLMQKMYLQPFTQEQLIADFYSQTALLLPKDKRLALLQQAHSLDPRNEELMINIASTSTTIGEMVTSLNTNLHTFPNYPELNYRYALSLIIASTVNSPQQKISSISPANDIPIEGIKQALPYLYRATRLLPEDRKYRATYLEMSNLVQ